MAAIRAAEKAATLAEWERLCRKHRIKHADELKELVNVSARVDRILTRRKRDCGPREVMEAVQ